LRNRLVGSQFHLSLSAHSSSSAAAGSDAQARKAAAQSRQENNHKSSTSVTRFSSSDLWAGVLGYCIDGDLAILVADRGDVQLGVIVRAIQLQQGLVWAGHISKNAGVTIGVYDANVVGVLSNNPLFAGSSSINISAERSHDANGSARIATRGTFGLCGQVPAKVEVERVSLRVHRRVRISSVLVQRFQVVEAIGSLELAIVWRFAAVSSIILMSLSLSMRKDEGDDNQQAQKYRTSHDLSLNYTTDVLQYYTHFNAL